MAALKAHDDLRADGLGSEVNTIVDNNEHYAEKMDGDAENTDFEAEKTDVDSSSGNAVGVLPEDTLAPSDYPEGLQFFFILIALILSIFMVALDLVRLLAFPIFLSSDSKSASADTFNPADYRSNGHPKDHGSIPQRFRDWMVRVGLLPHCSFIHLALGQALQVLPPQVGIPSRSLHLRIRQSHLWYVSVHPQELTYPLN